MNKEALVPFRIAPDAAGWQEVDFAVLGDERPPAPEFPASLFGEFWSRWLQQAAAAKGAPIDYVAAGLLAGCAASIGNARHALLYESSNWTEPPLLWFQLVGSPSSGKSPALDATFSMLSDIESDLNADWEGRRADYDAAKEAASVALEDWKGQVKTAAKEGVPPPQRPERAREPDRPERKRIRIGDATIEAVARILKANPKGLLCHRDELAGWLESFTRFSGGSDRPFWLEAYGARAYTVDRVKADGEPVFIPRLTVSVIGGIQPARLAPLFNREQDDGLQARFLSIWPEPVGVTRPGVIEGREQALNALRRLANLQMVTDQSGRLAPSYLPFTDGAEAVFHEWRTENHRPELEGLIGGHWGKLPNYFGRLALIMELMTWAADHPAEPEPGEISEKTATRVALLIDEYLKPMALRVYSEGGFAEDESDARNLGRWLRRTRQTVINVRDIRRNPPVQGLSGKGRLERAIEILCDAGVLRLVTSEGVGRPRGDYEVNPAIVEGER
ncbi:DUF3987 domain-containing protein [Limibacillus sp. MBR-115]|jgi:hypothetical protein|uniref:DUF3987 domain-containing protein n=1 Tax=Limibacillus sp. MBR-115 TaxID=3156465 RepID=UPI0033952EF0